MKNSKEIFRNLKRLITINEEPEEIESILYLVLQHVVGLSRADIISGKLVPVSVHQQNALDEIIVRINLHEPIQYIVEEAFFFGRKFKVSPAVLIPRPETELLIEAVLNEVNAHAPGSVLDIGTGSGCIAITLSKELPGKKVLALDVSVEALKIATVNARNLEAPVEFFQLNALTDALPFQQLELIVSNPPYVTSSEKKSMKRNVVDFEPHLALFVPDQDSLAFYKMISQKGYTMLAEHGKIAVEINERFGKKVVEVFKTGGFNSVRIVKDLQQKDRIVIATK